jgi:hypothetical protein
VFHWQTKSFAEHKAFGKTYSGLDEQIDEFIEIYIGKNERHVAKDKFNISLVNISENKEAVIDAFIDVLTEDLPKALEEKDIDIFIDHFIDSIEKLEKEKEAEKKREEDKKN